MLDMIPQDRDERDDDMIVRDEATSPAAAENSHVLAR